MKKIFGILQYIWKIGILNIDFLDNIQCVVSGENLQNKRADRYVNEICKC